MKIITIELHKEPIYDFVDAATYKRKEAAMQDYNDAAKDAVSSDSTEHHDGFLIEEYCDRWDAELRARLKFCLIDNEPEDGSEMVFDNRETYEESYIYKLKVEDSFTRNDLQSIGKKMDTYIKRGGIFSWYGNAGLEATDTAADITALADDIVYILRGRPWGKKPMQPFGPKFNDFYGRR